MHCSYGVAVFPKEIIPPVRKWMESSYTDIRHWSEMPKGGHFAAFEQPDPFVMCGPTSGCCGKDNASGSNLTLGTGGSGRFWAVHRHFGRTQM